MKLLTGLFRMARKSLMTSDTDMGMFRDKLNELVEGKDSLSEEQIGEKVDELKALCSDLPGDSGEELNRFLEDFRAVKEQDAEVAKKAAGKLADRFEELDTAAMQDVPGGNAEAENEDEGDKIDEVAEEAVEETVAPESEEAEDADPNPEYSLEEIYQYLKKRMAEDASCEEAGSDEATEDEDGEVTEESEEEDEEIVTDRSPRLAINLPKDQASNKGGLSALFAMAKGER